METGGCAYLTWEEGGGPRVAEPPPRGFGTRSVIASIESQFGGRAEFDWRLRGLLCSLSVPLSLHFATPDLDPRQHAADA